MTTIERPVRCPRCGYDLRGMVATWEASCPLTGRCTECGLEVSWSEVLQPQKYEPRWCIEFEPQRRRVPLACFWTLIRSLWPWRFWSELNMSHALRYRRLAAYVVLLFTPFVFLHVMPYATLAVYVRYQIGADVATDHREAVALSDAVATYLRAIEENASADEVAQARSAIPWGPSYDEYIASLSTEEMTNNREESEKNAAWLRQNPPSIRMSNLSAIVEAVFHPDARESTGSVKVAGSQMPYIPPAGLYEYARTGGPSYLKWWYSRPVIWALGVRIGDWITALMAPFVLFGLFCALMPLAFLAMPFSLARARVRWTHVLRVATYSAGVFATFLYVAAVITAVFAVRPTANPRSLETWLLFAMIPAAAVFVVWWQAAMSKYLRMPRSMLVAPILGVMNALAVIVFSVYILDRNLLRVW